ncbi:hypothetical protein IscW_ISCW001120 [Ixodes scapularis]|uniref:Immunoglobulin I-set domain-containing protein n=1 Tax=Ixodes scapularis TaxID=6945 RepID=B7P436_IXOSC|nr:hypothetical protein IscW_ISCW001120 [Ixodes scapularis]|eukprot:XP_002405237.1 hypothetical protein IscW_ISCW001120 [Ixodes scapularis]
MGVMSEDGETDLRPVSLVGARVSQLSNGTLFIREVRKEDAGNYHCTVSNGLGQDLHKLVTLSLHGECATLSYGVELLR